MWESYEGMPLDDWVGPRAFTMSAPSTLPHEKWLETESAT
jgi:hypothetical protein